MTIDTAINVSIPIAAFVIMFAIGLGLTRNDFRSALRSPKALLLGVVAQVVVVPIAGVLLVVVLRPEAALGLGIVILTLCPGGAMSNLLTRLADGDVALSVSLTAVTNLLSVLTLPALSVLASDIFFGVEVHRVDLREVVLRVAMISTVPVLLGSLVRHLAPRLVERHEAAVFRVAFVILVLIVGWAIAVSIEELRDGMLLLGWQLASLTLLLLGLGVALGRLFRLDMPKRTTVAIETGVQNSGLGLAVGSILWADPSSFPIYATPSAVYGVLTYLLILPLVLFVSHVARRRRFCQKDLP